MRTNRVYRRGTSEEETVAEIVRMRGTQFDPKVVDVFLDCREELAMIYDAWADGHAETTQAQAALAEGLEIR